ncbi:MAG TPA: MFS transporter [Candidatus Binatia bacterium]|nr:MFS transporter [Candidatus Binatia bacterium]
MEYKWLALTVTTVGVLMVGIDARIVIIGLPQVSEQLHADIEQAVWITQAYVLTNTLMLSLIGRLGDIFGRKKIYTYGFAIFTVGSALTSIGQNPTEVIIFRGIQGIGAALVFTNSIAILTDSAPRHQLGLFLGINQIAFRAGALLGLTLSGLILSFLDWRALFYINIPIGIFGTLWARLQLKETALLDMKRKIDWPGFAFFTAFLFCLMVGLTLGAYGSTGLTTAYTLLVSAAVLIVIFIIYERSAKYPLIYLHVFRIRQVSGGLFALLFNIITWTAVLLLLSLQFQLVDNLSPLQAGLRILPFEIAFLAVGPLSGRLADKYGQTQFILTGLTLSTVALSLFSTTGQATSYLVLSIYMVLLGMGTGLFVAPNLRAVMSSVPIERRGVGSALFILFLNIGLTVSLNLTVLIMSLTAPYDLITRILVAANPQSIPTSGIALFVDSLKNTYLVFAVINAMAIIPAIVGSRTKKTENSMEPVSVG